MKHLADLLGDSPGMRAIREQISRLLTRQQDARRLPPVLIEGETGTGKGLLARVIHRAGPRPDGPFVDVNCAAIPETLLEAEMFGFEKGAFTDARRSKPGLLQTAHRGTIFLDEVGLLSEGLQAKLLKVLEERTVRRLGATRDEPIDVWILTATNEDLKAAIQVRRFREDLYHRLAVLTLSLPPLRERGEDILMLAEHYLGRACSDYGVSAKTLGPDARAALRSYSWPGNVRELANLMERVALLSSDPVVGADALGLASAPPPKIAAPTTAAAGAMSSLDDAVRDRVVEVLRQTGWNISRTAALLGISRNTLRARIDKYGLRPGEVPSPEPRAPRPERRQARRVEPPPAPPEAAPPPGVAAPAAAAAPPPLEWERRRVTMLRASLLAPSAPETLLETNRALELVLDKVRSFGGTIEGRGPTGVAAAFGLDPTEDAPSRAAHAAMAVVNAVTRARQEVGSGPAIKVGVHTSPMLVGRGAGAPELDLEGKQAALIILNTVIERGAADSVTVSEPTAPFLTRGFEFRELDGEEHGRGRVFALVGRGRMGPGHGGRASTFVGRNRELELLSSRLESVIRGHGQIVGISGEAGIGKSRLIFEFRESLAGRGVTCLEGHCQPHGTAVPYLPILDVLRAACGIEEGDVRAVMADKARSTLLEAGLDLLETAPYVLHLLDIEPDDERFAAHSADVARARIFDALRQLTLKKSRKDPLVLIIEDLHWIDSTSEEYLASLAESLPGARLLLVCTHRGGYRPPWIDKSYATQVALQPLAPEESARIVRSVLGPDQAAAFYDLIVAKAEGNPFFVEELARTVREQMGGASPMTVPDTIEEVLGGRIDRLAPEDRRLLEIAAVVGKEVPFAVVHSVSGLTETALRRVFERLKSAEFVYETSPGPETEFTFKHTLTHEVAYGRVLRAARPALHARIVESMERLYHNRLAEQVDRLAHHALAGQAWAKAVDYLRQAAARAAARSAHRDAVVHLEQALAALGHLPRDRAWTEQAIDIRLDLRLTMLPLGELEPILSHLREAEALAAELGDQRRIGRVLVYLTGHYYQMGLNERALEYGKRTQAISDALRDFSLDVATNAYVGQLHLGLGEYRAATTLFRKNVEALVGDRMLERFGLPQLPAVHSRYCLVLCLAEMGEFAEGIVRGQESIRIAESIEQPLNLTAATSGLGRLYHRKGALEHAVPLLERALQLSRTWNLRIWLPQVATALGSSYAAMGRLAEALPLLEEAVSVGAAMRLLSAQAPALTALGEARLLEGSAAQSLTLAQAGLTVAQQNGRRGHEAWALRLLGDLALGRSEAPAASDYFGRALQLATALDMQPLRAHCHLGLGRARRMVADDDAAGRELAAAVDLFRAMDMGYWLAEASAAAREQR